MSTNRKRRVRTPNLFSSLTHSTFNAGSRVISERPDKKQTYAFSRRQKAMIKLRLGLMADLDNRYFDKITLQGLEFYFLIAIELLEGYREQTIYTEDIQKARRAIDDLLEVRFQKGVWKIESEQLDVFRRAVDLAIEVFHWSPEYKISNLQRRIAVEMTKDPRFPNYLNY